MNHFLDETELLNILHGFNPWWQGKGSTAHSFHRLAYQICLEYLKDLTLQRAVLLSGPRRVGKTTILKQIAATFLKEGLQANNIFYISLDHPLLKFLSLTQILDLYRRHLPVADAPIILLLDEIQYAKFWETEVKLLIDHQPQYRILATGSASVVHHNKLAESGVGRWITVPIPTLSFYEFMKLRGAELPSLSDTLRPADLFRFNQSQLNELAVQFNNTLPLFQRYLLVGGFPETTKREDLEFCQRLLREDVVERVLKRDMTALFGVRNVNELEKLFIYLCLHTGSIVEHKTCADALGTSTKTVANHLQFLEQANLIYCLRPDSISGKKILKARNKYYLVDAALRNAVLLRGEEVLTNSKDMGMIVETTILRHLYAYYYRDRPAILYWRDAATQKEVDIIVQSPNYTLPFEVKYQSQPKLSEDSGLVTYCKQREIPYAFWITKNDKDFNITTFKGISTQFLKIPAHIMSFLLGQAERLLWK